jgi:hypothetical protein
VENCCIRYSTAAFPILKLRGGNSTISVELAVGESELYLDNDPAFLQRVEKTGALSKGCPPKKELERREQ